MSYYKFKPNDLFVNTIEAYPDVKFYIQSGSIYINDEAYISGNYSDNITGVPRNYTSLYEYNINRDTNQRIYPYVVKDGLKTTFKNITKTQWNTQFNYAGNQITSSYNLSSSITRYRITSIDQVTATPTATSSTRNNSFYLRALKNTVNHYKYLSPYYNFDYYKNETNLINIPSMFYGSSIKKGSVNLKYYISGTLAAQASDTRYNGELVQVSGTTTGGIVGTVLYNEGIILLTSSAQIDGTTINYESATTSSWCRFGYGANDGVTISNTTLSASFSIELQGTTQIQTLTMLAKAPRSELNHSNNPTYLDNSVGSIKLVSSGSYQYLEKERDIKNIVSSSYSDVSPPLSKETYISKIAIYDHQKNLVGFAKLATPIRKTEDREFIFKLKLDL
jgi:hypothetical protein